MQRRREPAWWKYFLRRWVVFYKIFSILCNLLLKCISVLNCTFFIKYQCWSVSCGMDKILQTFFVSLKLWRKEEPYPNVPFCPEWSFWSVYLIVSPFCLKMIIVDIYWLLPRCQSLFWPLGVCYLIPSFLTSSFYRWGPLRHTQVHGISKIKNVSTRIQIPGRPSDF